MFEYNKDDYHDQSTLLLPNLELAFILPKNAPNRTNLKCFGRFIFRSPIEQFFLYDASGEKMKGYLMPTFQQKFVFAMMALNLFYIRYAIFIVLYNIDLLKWSLWLFHAFRTFFTTPCLRKKNLVVKKNSLGKIEVTLG